MSPKATEKTLCATRTTHGQWAKQGGKSNPGAKTDESGKAPPGDEGKGPDPKQADPRHPAQLTPYTNPTVGPLRYGGTPSCAVCSRLPRVMSWAYLDMPPGHRG